jgi:hypothetical protein
MRSAIPDARLFNPMVISGFLAAMVVAFSGLTVPQTNNSETTVLIERLIRNPFVLLIASVGIWALVYGMIQLWASAIYPQEREFLGWLSGQGGNRQKIPKANDNNLAANLFIERWQLLASRRMAPINFAIWVLPLLGFIGTVIGISDAIGSLGTVFADGNRAEALESVLGALRFAFDTTFAGLVLVIPVMGLSTWLALLDDRARERMLIQCHDDKKEVG